MSYIPTSYQFDNSTVDTSNIWVANAPNTGVANLSTSATLSLHGEGADIVVNGESLMETLKEIKKELRIPDKLNRNTELESEFEDLKIAAEHYESLVKQYKEKKRVWDILKTDL